jgi:hypothetical protein
MNNIHNLENVILKLPIYQCSYEYLIDMFSETKIHRLQTMTEIHEL